MNPPHPPHSDMGGPWGVTLVPGARCAVSAESPNAAWANQPHDRYNHPAWPLRNYRRSPRRYPHEPDTTPPTRPDLAPAPPTLSLGITHPSRSRKRVRTRNRAPDALSALLPAFHVPGGVNGSPGRPN